MSPENNTVFKKVGLYLYLIPLLAIAVWSEWQVYDYSDQRAVLKNDYSKVNSIEQGLLSVNSWKDQITNIITTQIDSFDLSQSQDSVLRAEVSDILNQLINKADSVVQNNDQTFGKKLRKLAVNVFIDKDELRREVPGFSNAIIDELRKPESKQRLKDLAHEKFNELAQKTYEKSDSLEIHTTFNKHGTNNLSEFNDYIENEIGKLENRTYAKTFLILLMLLLYLLPWIVIHLKDWTSLRKPLFNMSILMAISVLAVGVSTAMIEIDARISEVDFVLLGEHIEFKDQILFYRSKSILEVVQILLQTGKIDSILVGVLILAFSVLFPTSKMIATEIFIFGKQGLKENKLIRWLTFKSGKWSMADVMVVAIFMAYVGFNGILDNQMKALNMHSNTLTSIATNQTSLRPGFILFLCFVLYSLFLSALLKWVVSRKLDPEDL